MATLTLAPLSIQEMLELSPQVVLAQLLPVMDKLLLPAMAVAVAQMVSPPVVLVVWVETVVMVVMATHKRCRLAVLQQMALMVATAVLVAMAVQMT